MDAHILDVTNGSGSRGVTSTPWSAHRERLSFETLGKSGSVRGPGSESGWAIIFEVIGARDRREWRPRGGATAPAFGAADLEVAQEMPKAQRDLR